MSLPPFEVAILGTSSATPAYGRYPSAQLINFRQRFFLLDCGEGTQMQLRKYHFSLQRIERIFISHLHGDHFFGIFGLLGSMQLLGRKKELFLYAPGPLQDLLDKIWKISDSRLDFPLAFKTLNPNEKEIIFSDDFISVFSFPLKHRIDCVGFLFEEKPLPGKLIKEKIKGLKLLPCQYEDLKLGREVLTDDGKFLKPEDYVIPPPRPRSYVYCSDTCFYPELVQYFHEPTLLYHEATFDQSKKERAQQTFHSTAVEAGKMALLSKSKKLLIGHFSARYRDIGILLEEARSVFPETEAAVEGVIHSLS